MPDLHHVSDAGRLHELVPRPSPPGTEHEGRLLVRVVDTERLCNYLLPRDCPRVCWAAEPDDGENPLLATPARRVVVVEQHWLPASTQRRVREVREVTDCLGGIRLRNAAPRP